MKAKPYQNRLFRELKKYFGQDVIKEWDISKQARDSFILGHEIYAPRLDIAVGPFNTNSPSNTGPIFERVNDRFVRELFGQNERNQNPRCLLAIEIEFGDTRKHILGGMTNASMMGLFGIVIGSEKNFKAIERIYNYVCLLREVRKAPHRLFTNLRIFKSGEFLNLLEAKQSR